MTKIKNWIKKHPIIYGVGMLFVSLCMLVFGFAYFGMPAGPGDDEMVNDCCLEIDE